MEFDSPRTRPTATVRPSAAAMEDENARFIWRVYRWMSLGLGLTGLTAMMVASSPQALSLVFGNRFVFYALLLAELAMVWTFSTIARKASVTVAMALFLTYAITNGVTMAVVFLIYTARSIADVFLICTGMFAAMSFYGSVTKKDLTSVGSFSIMGLFGIILAGIVNLFVRSDMMSFVIACLGVVVFVGLTAYDTQKIKAMNVIGNEGTDDDTKEALNGALVLYLDFINLFLMLLRLLGKRR